VYGILYSTYDDSLRSKLVAEKEYQEMTSNKSFSAMKLYKMMRKICNGSVSMIGEDMLGNLMESLYNFLLIRGNDYNYLPKYLKVVEHRYNVLKELEFDLATDNLRDNFMAELMNQGQLKSQLYERLLR